MPSLFHKPKGGPASQVLFALILLASLALPACSTHPDVLSPSSPEATRLSNLFWLVVAVATVIFLIVEGLLVVAIVRYRSRPGAPAPRQVHGNRRLEIVWTIIPAVVVAGIFWATWETMEEVTERRPDALHVRVTGYQWWWKIEYPDLGITTATDMHVPLGEPVEVELIAGDVIHSFWAPALFGKTDVLPGHNTFSLFTPDAIVIFRGQCAEFCGAQHANMGFQIVVEPQERFDDWTRRMKTPASAPSGQPSAGAQAFQACGGCHTVQGTQSQGRIGPDLTHFASRKSIAALTLANTRDNLARWLADPQAVKPGTKMPNLSLSQEAIQGLVAYLENLK